MMPDRISGLGGTLISPRAAADWLARGAGDARIASSIAEWASAAAASLGPAASERRLLEVLVSLFGGRLGFFCRHDDGHAVAIAPSGAAFVLAARMWQRPLAPPSRRVLRACLDTGAAWAVMFNGTAIAIADARASAPRRVAVIPLDHLAARAETAALAGALLEASRAGRGAMAEAVRVSDAGCRDLERGLREGVDEALAALTRELSFDAGIMVLFRMLFVLFAEARSLAPVWHPLYRDHYSLGALANRRLRDDPRGVWASLEAGRRLLGRGCRIGTLHVAPFNGRLFAPAGIRRWARAASLESRLDKPASVALASLVEYRPSRGGARRINYAELDVEELGAIYERVLDRDPAGGGRARKESGTFYTPRPLTEFLVRRTLAPLAAGASSERILSLRVVDPAMGSGAFLVAALHFLANAVERARVAEGTLPEADVTELDRQQIRRLVAQRCLFGVDDNPAAVMLAKLSLWLATLEAGKPLSFLDHHLKCGNSLVGIEPAMAARPPAVRGPRAPLPLFDARASAAAVDAVAAGAARLALMDEDSLAGVRLKEKTYEALSGDAAATRRWTRLCDAWCAWWFAPESQQPDAREYGAVADALVGGARVLSRRRLDRRLREIARIHARHHFFHWPLEFADVFAAGGFDAVIGNPPWEMLRADAGSEGRAALKRFARDSGAYVLATGGHLNLYQLFVERALQIVRPEGRVGLIVPWGLMADDGSTAIRRRLVDGSAVDTLVRFDNNAGLFQAHRSLRFAAITATAGRPSPSVDIARASPLALDDLPDTGPFEHGAPIAREALGILSSALRIPDAAGPDALAVALKIARAHRALGDPAGWGASFGRELNLTDDRAHFALSGAAGMPVLEGKHVHPGRVDTRTPRYRISRKAACRLLPGRPFDRDRLAYRDVTAPTNTQTLIAAIVPAGCVTGHSLFCLRNAWDASAQGALCAILNSRVANFLIRLFVSAHVTTSLMAWLPVPERGPAVAALGSLAADDPAGRAEIDARVGALYGLSPHDLTTIG